MKSAWRRKRPLGLSLIEALVTILLVSLVFSLIVSLGRTQAKINRFQDVHERFIVDADGFFRVVQEDLASAFDFNESSGSTLMRIGHLTGRTSEGGRLPANSAMQVPSRHTGPNTIPPTSRGQSIRSVYTLHGERINRQYAEASFVPHGPQSFQSTVLDGVNAASATVDGANVNLRLTMRSETRVLTVNRTIFSPGLVP